MALDSGAFANVEDYIKALQAENEQLRAKSIRVGKLTFKVSEKGAVSVYGLGRFPVTLYQEQWDRLIAHIQELAAFIEDNRDSLKTKAEVQAAAPKANGNNGVHVAEF